MMSKAGREEEVGPFEKKLSNVRLDEVQVLCANKNSTPRCPGLFVLDSGASDHMVNDASLLENYSKTRGSVKVGDGSPIDVVGYGVLRMTTSSDCGDSTISLTHALCVPSLKDNIISVGKLEEKGAEIIFSDGKATASKNERFLFIAFCIGTMYVVKTTDFNDAIGDFESMVVRVSLSTWHERMGHLHLEALKNLPIRASEAKEAQTDCEVCIKSKIKDSPFPDRSEKTENVLVHPFRLNGSN